MKKHSKALSEVGKRKMIEQGMNVVASLDLPNAYAATGRTKATNLAT